ncbi:MAG: trypsin-like peptidase domain-containing protein [Anaerovoracaceae bacterium]
MSNFNFNDNDPNNLSGNGAGDQGGGSNKGFGYDPNFEFIPKNEQKKKQKKDKKSLSLGGIIAIIVIAALVSGATAFGVMFIGFDNGNTNKTSVSKNGYKLEEATGSKLTVAEIVEKNKKAVVEIKTESVQQDPWLRQYVTQGAGSGVIITEDGYIVTNRHVIDGASKIYVTLSNDKKYEAQLIGVSDTTDIAVIKIKGSKLTTATYGNSDQVNVGDMSVVIGNPLGELGGTVTAGIVSALDREITLDKQTLNLLQTDAAVNPGNSGGGMFNGDGQLIGIIVAKSGGESVESLGFAIPINDAAEVAQKIIKTGKDQSKAKAGTAYSGIQYASGNDGGIYVQSLMEDNAKKSGLKEGDQVLSIDGTTITDFDSISKVILTHKPGDKIKYIVSRNGATKQFKLTLIQHP